MKKDEYEQKKQVLINAYYNEPNITRKLVKESDITYTLITRDPKEIIRIFHYLYKDATIYMDRKYKTFKEIETMTFNDYNKAIS